MGDVEVRTGAALGATSGDALVAGGGHTGDGGDIVLGAGAATEAAARGGNVDIRADNSDRSTGGSVAIVSGASNSTGSGAIFVGNATLGPGGVSGGAWVSAGNSLAGYSATWR